MSAKTGFLEELRAALRKAPGGGVDDLIDYYDELISERVANGEKEDNVVSGLGTPKEIAASFKRDVVINRAVKRPTPSNGLKVLIAVLSVLSLPLLVPIAAVVIALTVAIIAVLIACVAGFIGVAASGVLAVIDMAVVVHAGDAPFYLFVLVLGGALIAVVLSYELLRGLVVLTRLGARSFIHWVKNRRDRNEEEQ
jgi:uncharacterized membrane protein